MLEAVGLVELTSIGLGYQAQDAMLKAGDVRVLVARTICSGKYFVGVTGPLAAVAAAVEAGVEAIPDGLIDQAVIPQIHAQVFAALGQSIEFHVSAAGGPQRGDGPGALPGALGVIETFTGTSILEAADAAAKAGAVTLLRVHLAMALGGKGYLLMAGSVADVQAAVQAGGQVARMKGLLVSAVTIPGPSRELLAEYI